MKKVSKLGNEESLLEPLRNEFFLAGTGYLIIPKSRIYNLFLLQNDFSWTSKESHFEAGKTTTWSIWTDFALRRRDRKFTASGLLLIEVNFQFARSCRRGVKLKFSLGEGPIRDKSRRHENSHFSRNASLEAFRKKSQARKKVGKVEIEETLLEHVRNDCPLGGTGDPKIPESRIYNLFLCQNEFSWTSKKSDLKQENHYLSDLN